MFDEKKTVCSGCFRHIGGDANMARNSVFFGGGGRDGNLMANNSRKCFIVLKFKMLGDCWESGDLESRYASWPSTKEFKHRNFAEFFRHWIPTFSHTIL